MQRWPLNFSKSGRLIRRHGGWIGVAVELLLGEGITLGQATWVPVCWDVELGFDF